MRSKSYFLKQVEQMRAEGIEMPDGDKLEEIRQTYLKGDYILEQGNAYFMDEIVKLTDPILQSIAVRKWIVMCPEHQDDHFITTDHPVRLDWAPYVENMRFPPGFMSRDTTVTFPVSHSVLILGILKRPVDDVETVYVSASKQEVADTNSHMIIGAKKYVFSAREDFIWGTSGGIDYISNREGVRRLTRDRRR